MKIIWSPLSIDRVSEIARYISLDNPDASKHWVEKLFGIVEKLKTFQRIKSGAKVIETDHPNKDKYPNQKIMIIDIDNYAYLVPFAIEESEYFLKTIIPSRKATKKYLVRRTPCGGGKNAKKTK